MAEDLVRWFGKQLDDDESAARAASEPEAWMELNRELRPSWYVQYWADPDVAAVIADPESSAYPVVATPAGMKEGDADARVQHIVRHDPARVLREVDAKRRLLARYVEHERLDRETFDAEGQHARSLVSLRAAYLDAVRELATVYADRPGYREEWRP